MCAIVHDVGDRYDVTDGSVQVLEAIQNVRHQHHVYAVVYCRLPDVHQGMYIWRMFKEMSLACVCVEHRSL